MKEPVEYWINSKDEIVRVNSAWVRFAEANGQSGLARVVWGRSLWEFVLDSSIRTLYGQILQRVRRGAPKGFCFPFRCDAPGLRRFMEMAISGEAEGMVKFSCRSVREEARQSAMDLWSPQPSSDDLVVVCSWCGRIRLEENVWAGIEEAVGPGKLLERIPNPALSHTICPACHQQMMELLEKTPMDRLTSYEE